MTHAMTEPKITREEIEAILKLAKAATPGPWQPIATSDPDTEFAVMAQPHPALRGFTKLICTVPDLSFDATYIAAANPAVLKALCTLALQAEAMQQLLRRVAELHLRESNAVKDNAVASIHDAAAIVRDVRAFLTSLPEPRR